MCVQLLLRQRAASGREATALESRRHSRSWPAQKKRQRWRKSLVRLDPRTSESLPEEHWMPNVSERDLSLYGNLAGLRCNGSEPGLKRYVAVRSLQK